MRIHDLTLNNFRVYAGENYFNLEPRKKYGYERPIILFGGLNGAGKTSILQGVRLALYGKASLGNAVSQKDYEDYLARSVHQPPSGKQAPRAASITLSFSYAKLGSESRYTVVRSWEKKGKSVKERLDVYQDDEEVSGLSYDQAQTFLNELIPIGVSELFFFDGEKIAELAEDSGGEALEYSIKKLLGLDIVERLSGDLTVLNRNLSRSSSSEEIREEIDALETRLNQVRTETEDLRNSISTANAEKAEVESQVNQLSEQLNDKGGHFIQTRQQLENKLENLQNERERLSRDIFQLMSEQAPLALAPEFTNRFRQQINSDLQAASSQATVAEMDAMEKEISETLSGKVDDEAKTTVDRVFQDKIARLKEKIPDKVIHDLTSVQASGLLSQLDRGESQKQTIQGLFTDLDQVETKIDELGGALARAPDDSVVQADFENLQAKQQELGRCEEKISNLKQIGKDKAQEALDLGRKLDKLYEQAAKQSDQTRVLSYMENTGNLLEEFVDRTAQEKVRDLEEQFSHCFERLARKDDLKVGIRIDPSNFTVALVNDSGEAIDRDRLSAGEKQIFAISILEALAKTSGRQLPMIVDTPLGRLDSHHRTKLIESYFPRASHQMIILSTDTEVDEEFYRSLSPEISRAFRLEYDSQTGATVAEQGYFWQKKKGRANVS